MTSSGDGKQRKFGEPQFFGAGTVGERGQIVIPAEARKAYGIETGDKLLIMGTPDKKGLWLGKIEDIRAFHAIMTMFLSQLDQVENENLEEKAEDQEIDD